MKILHLASGDLWAGAEVQLFHLVAALHRQASMEVRVVLLNSGQLEQELRAQGIEVTVLDETRLSAGVILTRLLSLTKSFQPDVIHTHRSKENLLGGLAARLSGKKSVRTVHGANEIASGPFDVRRLIINGLDRLAGVFLQQKSIAVSDELRTKLSSHYAANRLLVIENSINEQHVTVRASEPTEITFDTNCFNVGFVGRFVPVKRVDLFYDTAVRVLQARPDGNIVFHMLGDGPLMEEVMSRRQQQAGLEQRILLHGFVSNSAPLIKNMDLLMFTSDHEGLPMTLLEAMTLGVPVLSRNLTTIRQVLCDGDCGYILDSTDPQVLAQRVCHIADHPEDAAARAAQAKARIRARYSIDTNVQNYIALYASLMS